MKEEMAKFRCNFCKRIKEHPMCIGFVADEGNFIGIPLGTNFRMDVECYLSFLAQHLEMNNRTLNKYLNWILNCN